eukprot:scaffold156_cov308-Prasinococcus_capsulatus_cf.AAC.25
MACQVLVGASLGGSAAIDFAHAHPDKVALLVLVDAQGYIDGIGPMAEMPRFLADIGVAVLKVWLPPCVPGVVLAASGRG